MDKAEEFSRKLRALEIMNMMYWNYRPNKEFSKWYHTSELSPYKDITDEKVLCWVPSYCGMHFPMYSTTRNENADFSLGDFLWYENEHFDWASRRDVEYGDLDVADRKQIIGAACIYTHNEKGELLFLMLQLPNTSKYVQSYHPGTLTFPQGHIIEADCKDFEHIGDPRVLKDTIINGIQRELNEELYAQHVGGFRQSVVNLRAVIENLEMQYTCGKGSMEHFVYIDDVGTTSHHHWFCYEFPVESIYDSMDDVAIMSGEPEKHTVVWKTLPQIYDEWMKGNVCPYVMRVLPHLYLWATERPESFDFNKIFTDLCNDLKPSN